MGRFVQYFFQPSNRFLVAVTILPLLTLVGCDRLNLRPDSKKQMQLGSDRLAARDFRGAVAAYEEALDGTPKTAEAHFRLALIYYDHLQDPVGAIHHFRRYLEVAGENGSFAKQARANITRAELTLATGLSGGTLVSRGEAARIRTENLQLKQQLAIAKATSPAPKAGAKSTSTEASDIATGQRAANAALKEAERKAKTETRTYKVQPGDTLQGISRKFYQTPNRAADIVDANINQLPDESKLKAGMTLIIP